MISILIPVYNQTVVPLVSNLRAQCEELGIQYQILVFDDKSKEEWKLTNKKLENEFGVNYVELSDNLGRAKIRNRLGRTARYDYCLFLDGDSKIIRKDFIKTYVDHIGESDVVYGGREYQKEKPSNPSLVLHWKYGKTNEALPVKNRIKDPSLNFQSNNFLIKTSIFEKTLFDVDIEGYGYEDLLFAQKIKSLSYNILHIDNPVLHDGLEPCEDFLKKTVNAVGNLAELNKKDQLQNVRLTKFYQMLKRNTFLGAFGWYYKLREDSIISNLKSKNPSIRNFSFFKLAEYIKRIHLLFLIVLFS